MKVNIYVLDDALEAIAIRSCLEYWGVHTNVYFIGQPMDFVRLINEGCKNTDFHIVSGHGDKGGVIFPELAESLKDHQPFIDRLKPKDVKENLKLRGKFILSSACMSGDQSMGNAFIDAGASFFIGPNAYPDGNAALYFMLSFYYNLGHHNLDILSSYECALKSDKDAGIFQLYSDKN